MLFKNASFLSLFHAATYKCPLGRVMNIIEKELNQTLEKEIHLTQFAISEWLKVSAYFTHGLHKLFKAYMYQAI